MPRKLASSATGEFYAVNTLDVPMGRIIILKGKTVPGYPIARVYVECGTLHAICDNHGNRWWNLTDEEKDDVQTLLDELLKLGVVKELPDDRRPRWTAHHNRLNRFINRTRQ